MNVCEEPLEEYEITFVESAVPERYTTVALVDRGLLSRLTSSFMSILHYNTLLGSVHLVPSSHNFRQHAVSISLDTRSTNSSFENFYVNFIWVSTFNSRHFEWHFFDSGLYRTGLHFVSKNCTEHVNKMKGKKWTSVCVSGAQKFCSRAILAKSRTIQKLLSKRYIEPMIQFNRIAIPWSIWHEIDHGYKFLINYGIYRATVWNSASKLCERVTLIATKLRSHEQGRPRKSPPRSRYGDRRVRSTVINSLFGVPTYS